MTSWRARPEAMFEQVTHPDDLNDVLDVLALGAPVGFAPNHAAIGLGAKWIMPPFFRPTPSRFSNGTRYGVFYASQHQTTAIAETTFHYGRFLMASNEEPTILGVQLLRCHVTGDMMDIRGAQATRPELYDPDPARYGSAQQWADSLHREDHPGVVYSSVRDAGGECVAVFHPRCITHCTVDGYLAYEWDGTTIIRAYRMDEVWRS